MHAGESDAARRITSLYHAHSTDVFRYALHLTGRREDAEDVVQFVFLRAYGMLESGTQLVSPRAWLIKATKHRSLNLIRDRREASTADAELAAAPTYDPDPAEAEALAEVRSTLWALPENQHQAFVLRHWSGLSQDEIAEVLATTPGAVESLLVRARTTLLRDHDEARECVGVRRRLVQALIPTPGQESHIATCRRCKTARTRLLRASEFATAFALVPQPHVAHALASAIPGFGAHAAAAATATTGAAAGGGTGVATASAATKLTLLTKVALATATTVVALGATHPVRSAVTGFVLGHHAASVASRQPGSTNAAAAGTATDATATSATRAISAAGRAAAPGRAKGSSSGQAHGNGKAKVKGKPATPGANGGAKGKPATPGASGAAKGKSATAGANGNANANGNSAAAGANGKAPAKGKPAAAGENGKPATEPTGTTVPGNGKRNGKT